MSIDFRGQIIEAIQNSVHTTDEKVLLISELPIQVTEVYFGACRSIIEGNEPVAGKLRLLQATFSSLPVENEYTLAEKDSPNGRRRGVPGESLIVLELRTLGDKGVTPKLVQDLESALPDCTLTEDASDKVLTLTVDAAHRLDVVEALRRTLYDHGFVRRDKSSAG